MALNHPSCRGLCWGQRDRSVIASLPILIKGLTAVGELRWRNQRAMNSRLSRPSEEVAANAFTLGKLEAAGSAGLSQPCGRR
jgi:hypothetical protein